jgi:hypothetical protein
MILIKRITDGKINRALSIIKGHLTVSVYEWMISAMGQNLIAKLKETTLDFLSHFQRLLKNKKYVLENFKN